jgi:hypothetical protein
MKPYFFYAIFLFSSIFVFGQDKKKEPDGFFGVKFGSSKAATKAAMTAKGGVVLKNSNDVDYYNNLNFGGYSVLFVSYKFKNNALIEGGAYIQCKAIDVLDTYKAIVSGIQEKYGEPLLKEEKFVSPFKMGDGNEVLAIETGNASFTTGWSFEKMIILVSITDKLIVTINYSPKEDKEATSDF